MGNGDNYVYGYWVENPHSNNINNRTGIYVRVNIREVFPLEVGVNSNAGIRPVITVLTSNIDY